MQNQFYPNPMACAPVTSPAISKTTPMVIPPPMDMKATTHTEADLYEFLELTCTCLKVFTWIEAVTAVTILTIGIIT